MTAFFFWEQINIWAMEVPLAHHRCWKAKSQIPAEQQPASLGLDLPPRHLPVLFLRAGLSTSLWGAEHGPGVLPAATHPWEAGHVPAARPPPLPVLFHLFVSILPSQKDIPSQVPRS